MLDRLRSIRTAALPAVAVLTLATALTGCVAGEGSGSGGASTAAAAEGSSGGAGGAKTLTVDFATYNPLSLVIKDQGWLEKDLASQGVTVTWVQSAGSNKANELLRSGSADVASTAGSAALLARANGSPIKTIDVYSQPNWSALVVRGDSPITGPKDLVGKKVAATTGTDPYFFLLQSLKAEGVDVADVDVVNLQHADGRTALDTGQVDAWAGLDPIMAAAQAQNGDKIVYDDVDFNSYGFLNATESFLESSPKLAQTVVDEYERARAWAQANPDETAAILAKVSGVDPAIAKATLARTTLDLDPAPGAKQEAVLEVIGPILVANGDVAQQSDVDDALKTLFDPSLAKKADPGIGS